MPRVYLWKALVRFDCLAPRGRSTRKSYSKKHLRIRLSNVISHTQYFFYILSHHSFSFSFSSSSPFFLSWIDFSPWIFFLFFLFIYFYFFSLYLFTNFVEISWEIFQIPSDKINFKKDFSDATDGLVFEGKEVNKRKR